MNAMRSIAIIGAGYAGMACAVELAAAGFQVNVFERSHVLGGRARVLDKNGHRVDNGQHILLGAYTELERLLRATRVSPKVLERRPLTLYYPDGPRLRAARLPAPLHLALGVLRARGLGHDDRKAMLRFMRWLKQREFRLAPGTTVRTLLHETGQTRTLRERIWGPLCVAALNTPVDQACAQTFANVLRDSIAAHAGASDLLLPRVDLSELFPVQAARYLAVRRGKIRTGTTVQAIVVDDDGFRLECDQPTRQRFDQVIVAVAPYHCGTLLRSTGRCDRLAALVDAIPHEPITTSYLALGPSVRLPEVMIGLADGPAQWAFDLGVLGRETGLIACVISASGPHSRLDREELEIAIHRQLEQQLQQRLPAPQWTQTITEKRATFACRPDVVRPDLRTPLPGLWLAGDYLQSPYPATLESAVRSGVAAARAVMRHTGRG